MPSEIAVLPDIKKIEAKGLEAVEAAKSLVVTTPEGYLFATGFVKGLKQLAKDIENDFADSKDKAHKAWKSVVAQEAGHLKPVEEAVRIANSKITPYLEAEEKKRQDEERRLNEEARKREEDERIATAAQAEKEGHKEEAEAILNVPAPVPTVVVPKAVPKAQGTSMSYRYSAKVTNLMALVKAVAAGKAPITALQADTVALNRMASSLKEGMDYPGVEVVKQAQMAYR